MLFRLNCTITGDLQTISGKSHRQVQRSDGSSFFLDPAFLFALENINRENLKRRLCERFAATDAEAEAIVSTIIKTRLVVNDEGGRMKDEGERMRSALMYDSSFILHNSAFPSERPRIGILTERMKLGYGVDLVVHETAGRLTNRGYEVTVFTGSVEAIYGSVNYEVVRLGGAERLADVFSQEFFERAILSLRKSRIDVWIVESLPFYYWRDSLPGPVIFVEHGTPFPELFPRDVSLSVRLARLTKRERVFSAIRPTDRIVAVSRFIASELPRSAADRTQIIYNGCDHYPLIQADAAREFRGESGLSDTDVLLAYVGRIDFDGRKQPYKSVDRLLEVWQRINADMPHVRLLLAGRADADIERQLREKHVIPMLNVAEEKVALVLAAADLFVSMSLWEGFDLPLFEAQFQGTPCVAMRCGAHPELIDGTGAGALAEDEAEFERSIRKLAKDRDSLSEMSRRAKENSKRFLWDTSVDRMQALVEDVHAGYCTGCSVLGSRPTSNVRFALVVAKEVLLHEGPIAFARLAIDKLRRMRGRR